MTWRSAGLARRHRIIDPDASPRPEYYKWQTHTSDLSLLKSRFRLTLGEQELGEIDTLEGVQAVIDAVSQRGKKEDEAKKVPINTCISQGTLQDSHLLSVSAANGRK